VWGSLRPAPICTLLGWQNEYELKKEVLLSEQTYLGSTEIFASDKKTDANRSEEATVTVY